jgi:ABC-type transport system involved in cytochrome bd biosynthesis fused ATPase/permease subunit
MTLDELYQIKVESYRDFRNHLLSCFNAYTVSVGLLGYFAFQAHGDGNEEQFRVLWCLLIGLLTLALLLSRYYIRHAHRTAEHVEKLSKQLKVADSGIEVADFSEDGDGMRAAMRAFAALNLIAWLSSLFVLFMYLW